MSDIGYVHQEGMDNTQTCSTQIKCGICGKEDARMGVYAMQTFLGKGWKFDYKGYCCLCPDCAGKLDADDEKRDYSDGFTSGIWQ